MPKHVYWMVFWSSVCWLGSPGVLAAEDGAKDYESQWGLALEKSELDNGSPDWQEFALQWRRKYPDQQVRYVTLRQTDRFDLTDEELGLGVYLPKPDGWGLTLEASLSPDADVLPESSLSLGITAPLAKGWVGQFGVRRSAYSEDDVNLVRLGTEYYWGNFRAAYTIYHGQLVGSDSGISHLLQADYYYGDGSRIGMGLAKGQEASRIDPTTVIVSDVETVSLVGEHWLSPTWGISYSLGEFEQGSFYTRKAARLGFIVRY